MRKATSTAFILLLAATQSALGATYNMTLSYFDWQEPSTLVDSSACKIHYAAGLNDRYTSTCYYNVNIYLSLDASLNTEYDFLFHTERRPLYAGSYWNPMQQTLYAPGGGWRLPANGQYYVFMEIERDDFAPPDTNPSDNIYMDGFRITVNSGILPEATVSGYVRTAGGQGIGGVAMNGLPGSPVTNAQGFYSGTVDHGFSGTVVPWAACYNLTPASRTYSSVMSDQTNQNYTAALKQPRISGHVLLPSGKPVAGADVRIGEEGPVVTTDFEGCYSTVVECGWSGVITPTKDNYTFIPESRNVTNVTSDSVQDFTASREGTIYVDPEAGGLYDGSSWANAFYNLQDALLEAGPGTDIYVAGGVYRPDQGGVSTIGDRHSTFQLASGASLYGGFPNGGGDFSERDFGQHATVLSGDLRPGQAGRGENALHVVTGGDGATLDGFVIVGGNADSGTGTDGRGGGMYNSEAGVVVRNCVFMDNYAYQSGGAIYTASAAAGSGLSLRLENCTFTDNAAQKGGAVYAEGLAGVYMAGCRFSADNIADDDVPYYGGAVYNNECGRVDALECVFRGNAAREDGGAMKNESVDTAVVRGCVFFNNLTTYGPGSGMYNRYSSCTAINCTFAGNAASYIGNGAGIFSSNSSLKVTNCIFWQNTGNGTATQAAQIYSSPQPADMNYCCVQRLAVGATGVGNFKTDPNFVDLDGGDLHLNAVSPCVNKGNPGGNYADRYDMDGDRRVRYGRVDIGADEYVGMPGDFQPDGIVNIMDAAMLAGYWGNACAAPGWCSETDIDQSENIDAADLAILSEGWLNTQP